MSRAELAVVAAGLSVAALLLSFFLVPSGPKPAQPAQGEPHRAKAAAYFDASISIGSREPAPQETDVLPALTRPAPSPSPELVELQARVRDLEAALASCQATDTVGAWLATLRPGERPSDGELKILAEWLEPYPVRLLPGEGLLLATWIKEPGAELWRDYGPTIDEALITFLGPARIAREVPAEKLAELREAWAEEIPQWR